MARNWVWASGPSTWFVRNPLTGWYCLFGQGFEIIAGYDVDDIITCLQNLVGQQLRNKNRTFGYAKVELTGQVRFNSIQKSPV